MHWTFNIKPWKNWYWFVWLVWMYSTLDQTYVLSSVFASVPLKKNVGRKLNKLAKLVHIHFSYVRKCLRGTDPEARVGSGHRRAEAPLASTSRWNCILLLSLFFACFSFPIFTTEAHLPAASQAPSWIGSAQQHPTVTSLQLGRI